MAHRSVVRRGRAGRPRGPVAQRGGASASTVGQQNLAAAEQLVKKSGNRLNIGLALQRIEEVRAARELRLKKKAKRVKG